MLADVLNQLGSLASSYVALRKNNYPTETNANVNKEHGESSGENVGSSNPFSEEGIQA
jgi:hypothetical protein